VTSILGMSIHSRSRRLRSRTASRRVVLTPRTPRTPRARDADETPESDSAVAHCQALQLLPVDVYECRRLVDRSAEKVTWRHVLGADLVPHIIAFSLIIQFVVLGRDPRTHDESQEKEVEQILGIEFVTNFYFFTLPQVMVAAFFIYGSGGQLHRDWFGYKCVYRSTGKPVSSSHLFWYAVIKHIIKHALGGYYHLGILFIYSNALFKQRSVMLEDYVLDVRCVPLDFEV
jgi:hypothetical protein